MGAWGPGSEPQLHIYTKEFFYEPVLLMCVFLSGILGGHQMINRKALKGMLCQMVCIILGSCYLLYMYKKLSNSRTGMDLSTYVTRLFVSHA